METRHHVVIVGGGFGGLHAARALKRAPVRVTLIDRRNFHLFQPLLYQVATGGLSPADIASPLRGILSHQKNVHVVLGEVTGFDLPNHIVRLADHAIHFDSLIVATGVRHHYFGNTDWEHHAPGLKTIEDALAIRRRILYAFEAAERETDPALVQAWLTFVVVGGGPTGVEMAGAIGEIAHFTLRNNFRSIDPSQARIYLVEGLNQVLSNYRPKLAARAANDLQQMGIDVHLNTMVTDIQADHVVLKSGASTQEIQAKTIIWAAGVQASPLGKQLAGAADAEVDRLGRVLVEPDMSLPNYPHVFVIGDLANRPDVEGQPLPGVALVAIQQGKYVARLLIKRLNNESTSPPFRYINLGSMATIGRARAVADMGWLRLTGYWGWLAWLFVHLMRLVGYENRISVFVQWAYNYVTRNRSARLITGEGE
ncbi:MAG: NAD(P)/FAD-dependent oxidoreductase [Anaerolineales bacterium]|nr:NAD(P)/FAD-dependent oxidoreductase [Anaerolineales bacterium]